MFFLNKLMFSFFVLLLLCSPLPMMAKSIKTHGSHEKTRLHDNQQKSMGRDKEIRADRRKKFVPPPQKIQEVEEPKEEEAV